MDCKCGKELLIDHVNKDGRYFYVCLNPACDMYRKPFNPSTEDREEPQIKERDTANNATSVNGAES